MKPPSPRDAPGASRPTTFPRRGQPTMTFEHGPLTELSHDFTTPFGDEFALRQAGTRDRARRASTVGRRRPTNEGDRRVRCRQDDHEARAPHPDGHDGPILAAV